MSLSQNRFRIRINVQRNKISVQEAVPVGGPVLAAMEIGLDKHGPKTFWRGVQLISEAGCASESLAKLPLGDFLRDTVMHKGLYRQHARMRGQDFVRLIEEAAHDRRHATGFPDSYQDLCETLGTSGENRVDPRPK